MCVHLSPTILSEFIAENYKILTQLTQHVETMRTRVVSVVHLTEPPISGLSPNYVELSTPH